MPLLPLRDWLYFAAIIIIVVALGLWHHSAMLAGEARVRAADARAVARAQAAAIVQQEHDNETAGVALHDLQNELADARRAAGVPAPVVRLCGRSAGSRPPGPPPADTGPAQPGSPGAGNLPEVPPGAGAGPDLGPGLQRVAFACELVSARDRALLEWARGVSK